MAARKWAGAIWPEKYKYTNRVQAEYSKYTSNTGYQTINTALRDAEGDISKFTDQDWLDARKDYEGNNYSAFVKTDYIDNLADRVKAMDDGMDFAPRVPDWVVVSRGTRWQEFKNLGITGQSDDFTQLAGKTYTNDAFTSTSLGGKAAMDYMDVQISITLPPGLKAVNLAGNESHESHGGALSSLVSENEFLLNRGTEFQITKVTKVGSKWIIETEALLP